MRNIIRLVFTGMLLMVLLTGVASGEIIRPIGMQQTGYDAVVLSKTVTVRTDQNTNAKAVTKLNYGDHVTVLSLGNGWCECYLAENEGVSGYAMEDYLLVNPAYITIDEAAAVYAWQSTSAKRVGFLARGETYPIIRMDGNWLLISLRGAAGWLVRPSGDTTGTARMRTRDVLNKAESYLLSTKPWAGGERLTEESLKNYYSFVDYDSSTGEWLVTFDSINGAFFEVAVDDSTGYASDYESGNG